MYMYFFIQISKHLGMCGSKLEIVIIKQHIYFLLCKKKDLTAVFTQMPKK